MHMRIKTVSESTEKKTENCSSKDLQILQGKYANSRTN